MSTSKTEGKGGPSSAALQRAIRGPHGNFTRMAAYDALHDAHDAALGLDRSVCLRDIVEFFEPGSPIAAKWLRDEFGGRDGNVSRRGAARMTGTEGKP